MFLRKIYLFIAFCLLNTSIYAQELSKDSLEYNVNIKLSGSRMTGFFNRSAFAFVADKHLHIGKWTFHNNLSYRYSIFNEIQIENNWYELLTISYAPNERKIWYPLAFYHFDNNLLFRVNSRHRYGVGIGSHIVETGNVFFQFGGGFGYEATIYDGDIFINSDLNDVLRQNGLLMLSLNNNYILLKGRFALKLNVFYMQSLKENTDYEIWFRPSLQYAINKHIALLINYDYRFENVYLEGLTSNNDILLFGINVNFANK